MQTRCTKRILGLLLGMCLLLGAFPVLAYPPADDPFAPLLAEVDSGTLPKLTALDTVKLIEDSSKAVRTITPEADENAMYMGKTYTDGAVKTEFFTFQSLPVYLEGFQDDTEVFGYLMYPASATDGSNLPGMLLLHGGGGSAQFVNQYEQAKRWAEAGYVVACCDLPGIAGIQDSAGSDLMSSGAWTTVAYNDLTPYRFTVTPDGDPTGTPDPKISWLYTAEGGAVKLFSLLYNNALVDRTKMGVTGISWGGYSATFLGGLLGDRVQAVVSTYGSGYYEEESAFHTFIRPEYSTSYIKTQEALDCFLTYLDAGRRSENMTAAYYVGAGTNDNWFRPVAVTKTLSAMQSADARLGFSPNDNHAFKLPGGTGVTRRSNMRIEESFFDYHLKGEGFGFNEIAYTGEPYRNPAPADPAKPDALVAFAVTKAAGSTAFLAKPELWYSEKTELWTAREWKKLDPANISETGTQGDTTNYLASIPYDIAALDVDFYVLVSDYVEDPGASVTFPNEKGRSTVSTFMKNTRGLVVDVPKEVSTVFSMTPGEAAAGGELWLQSSSVGTGQIEVVGDLLYVVGRHASDGMLYVYQLNAGNPSQRPTLLKSIPLGALGTDGSPDMTYFRNGVLYTASYDGRSVDMIDVRNLENVTKRSFVSCNNYTSGATTAGTLRGLGGYEDALYVSDSVGMRVIDVSDPDKVTEEALAAEIAELASYGVSSNQTVTRGVGDVPDGVDKVLKMVIPRADLVGADPVQKIVAHDGRLYVMGKRSWYDAAVFDLTDPLRLTPVDPSDKLPNKMGSTIVANHLSQASIQAGGTGELGLGNVHEANISGFHVNDDYMVVVNEGGLDENRTFGDGGIVSVARRTDDGLGLGENNWFQIPKVNPVEGKSHNMMINSSRLEGSYLLLAEYRGECRIVLVDISDVANPRVVAQLEQGTATGNQFVRNQRYKDTIYLAETWKGIRAIRAYDIVLDNLAEGDSIPAGTFTLEGHAFNADQMLVTVDGGVPFDVDVNPNNSKFTASLAGLTAGRHTVSVQAISRLTGEPAVEEVDGDLLPVSKTVSFTVSGEGAKVTFTRDGEELGNTLLKGEIKATLSEEALAGVDGDAVFILALYEDGALVSVKCKAVSSETADKSITITVPGDTTLDIPPEGMELRAMLWSDLEGQRPLMDVAVKRGN